MGKCYLGLRASRFIPGYSDFAPLGLLEQMPLPRIFLCVPQRTLRQKCISDIIRCAESAINNRFGISLPAQKLFSGALQISLRFSDYRALTH